MGAKVSGLPPALLRFQCRRLTSDLRKSEGCISCFQEFATAQPGQDASMAPQMDFTHPGVSFFRLTSLYPPFLPTAYEAGPLEL